MGWHGREPFPDQHTLTRDDLIRLVVGMQWHTAVALLYYDAIVDVQGASLHRDAGDFTNTTPACDIVDEWLGVEP